ncbi:hypothetical protein ACLOJK_032921 [Asimina triloba]
MGDMALTKAVEAEYAAVGADALAKQSVDQVEALKGKSNVARDMALTKVVEAEYAAVGADTLTKQSAVQVEVLKGEFGVMQVEL